MKKLYATVIKNGEEKTVFAFVDDETAKVLEQVTEKEFVDQYIYDEYKLQMGNINHARMEQSLDKSIENGFDTIDERSNLEENLIAQLDNEVLHRAIEKLQPQQKWLVTEIYFNGRKQVEIAKELGVNKPAISRRLSRVLERLKKILENF